MADDTQETDVQESIADLSLDDAFNDSTETETEAKPAEETEEAEDKGETDTADDESAEKSEESEPPSDESNVEGLKAALVAERRRRQAAEAKVAETVEAPDPVEDPEGFKAHQSQQAWNDKATASRDVMLDVYPDYEEKEKVFLSLVTDSEGAITDPTLVAKMQASRNPAKFVYEHVREHEEIQKFRDPERRKALEAEIEAKVRKDVEAKVRAELKAKPEGVTAAQVPDLTRATATGKNTDDQPTEEGLDEVMAGAPLG